MRLPIITVAKINFYPSSSKPSVDQWRGTQGRTGRHAGADAVRQKLLYTNTNNPDNRHPEIVGPIPSTASVSRHPRPENIPSLLARLVGKKQETWPFLEPRFLCACVCLHISHQRGGRSNICFFFFFSFPPPHDTPPVFLGSGTTRILATKFFWRALLNVVTQWLPSF